MTVQILKCLDLSLSSQVKGLPLPIIIVSRVGHHWGGETRGDVGGVSVVRLVGCVAMVHTRTAAAAAVVVVSEPMAAVMRSVAAMTSSNLVIIFHRLACRFLSRLRRRLVCGC